MFLMAAGESDIHVSLKAEEVFKIGDLSVTNSMIYGTIVAIFMGVVLLLIARKSKVRPQKGAVALLEIMVQFVVGVLEGAFGSKKLAYRYAPIFAFFFLFIMFSNVLGLVPIVGPGVEVTTAEGDIPVFRPFTADLNGTLVMAVTGIVLVQYLSIKELGIKGHLTHYFSDKPLNPINFFIGVLEVFGELTRILSLSLRLFLNTAVGEILIAVFTSIVISNGRTPFIVIPIILFEVLVAGIQAYVFTVLCATYLALNIAHAHHEEEHHEPALKVEEITA